MSRRTVKIDRWEVSLTTYPATGTKGVILWMEVIEPEPKRTTEIEVTVKPVGPNYGKHHRFVLFEQVRS